MDDLEEQLQDIASDKWEETNPEGIIAQFNQKGKASREKILAMKPGRELNIIVAKYVLGYDVVTDKFLGELERQKDSDESSIWSIPLGYSEDNEAAQNVVCAMMDKGFLDAPRWDQFGDGAYTPAEAICKKALLCILEQ
jgi:hypothetical protein